MLTGKFKTSHSNNLSTRPSPEAHDDLGSLSKPQPRPLRSQRTKLSQSVSARYSEYIGVLPKRVRRGKDVLVRTEAKQPVQAS